MGNDHRTIGTVRFPQSVLTYLSPDDPDLALARSARHVDMWERELGSLEPWLPDPCDTVVDIGCGLGGIDFSLARAGRARNFVLIDGAGDLENKQHGYQEVTKAWADVCQAQILFCENAPDAGCVAFTPDHGRKSWPCDLLLSFKSCAFHYHVNTYLDFICASVRENGRLIIDVRRDTDNADVIERSGFKRIGLVESNAKRDRLVFSKSTG